MKLLRGAPGSGKTRRVFREFKDALRSGETNLRIVVPTATLVRHFQHELARDGVVFSPRCIVSLNRFLLERADDVKLVPDGLLRAIARDSLQRLPFPEFASVAGTEGMAATIVDTIGLFENAGCAPDKLSQVLRRLGAHARPFEKLWRTVGDAVRDRGYQMRSGWIRAASANVQPARVWLDGFLNFSPIEHEFLRALDKVCDVTLTLPANDAANETYRFALALGAQDHLLPGSPRKPRTTVVSASALEREADEIARRILALQQQGTDFREIGVALRDDATYVHLLKGTFDRFGIPARFYFRSPLRKHPVATFLNGLISGALAGWDFESTLQTLRANPRWGLRADFDRFDFAVREAMPGRGAKQLLDLCEAPWLKDEISSCLKTESWNKTLQRPADWVQRFQSLASNLYRPGTLDPAPDHTAIEAARSHIAALRSWIAAVESIAPFWTNPEQPVSLTDFWSIASVAIEAALLHPLDDRASVVHVMNAWEARQWDIASLFVCGMSDRDFPLRQSQNLLFPDADIEALRKAGLPLRSASDYENDERWLFDSLKSRAVDSLILTYPEHDAAGKSMQPSRFIQWPAEPAASCQPSPRIAAAAPASAGIIVPPKLQIELARLHQSISLTALEDLAQCRFRFFSRKTLLLESAPERPDKRINPRTSGSILHVAMERWLTDRSQNFVAVFEAAFDETCASERLPAGYRLEVQRIELRRIAEHISATDRWQPDAPPEVEIPLTLQFPAGIQVTCRIDRLDRFGNDCVIIDYKSGKTARVEKLVTSPAKLQGPLYALAVREQRNLNPVAMIFWGVREDQLHGWGAIPNSNIELSPIPNNWMADAKARIVERLTSFLGGSVGAQPEDTEDCVWCDYRDACRIEQQTLVQIGAGQLA